MANHLRPIRVSAADRRELDRLQRAASAPAGLVRRAGPLIQERVPTRRKGARLVEHT